MTTCGSNIPLNDFSRLAYTTPNANVISRISVLNTGRFRTRSICSITCIDTSLTPWFKNSVQNQYLATIPYPQRLKNIIVAGQAQGTSTKIVKVCVDRQYGRKCGTGGMAPTNNLI